MSEVEIDAKSKLSLLTIYCLSLTTFAVGGTILIALLLCFIFKKQGQGSWLESHYRWQVRTILFTLLWAVISLALICLVIVSNSDIAAIFSVIGCVFLICTAFWYLYRTIKGLTSFNASRPMYANA